MTSNSGVGGNEDILFLWRSVLFEVLPGESFKDVWMSYLLTRYQLSVVIHSGIRYSTEA